MKKLAVTLFAFAPLALLPACKSTEAPKAPTVIIITIKERSAPRTEVRESAVPPRRQDNRPRPTPIRAHRLRPEKYPPQETKPDISESWRKPQPTPAPPQSTPAPGKPLDTHDKCGCREALQKDVQDVPRQMPLSPREAIRQLTPAPEKIPDELLAIAKCESGNRQFNPDGSVVRGNMNRHDIGRFQINEKLWAIKARELGFDIYTKSGNTSFAIWLYQKFGTAPWSWSSKCWSGHHQSDRNTSPEHLKQVRELLAMIRELMRSQSLSE